MSSRHLSHIETNYLTKGLNFFITSKTLADKDIIATIKNAAKDLGKKEVDTIRAKTSLTIQIFKPPKDKLSIDKWKTSKKLQSTALVVNLPADKVRSSVIVSGEDYSKSPILVTWKRSNQRNQSQDIETKTGKENEFIDNKLYYYLKPTDSPTPRVYWSTKIPKSGVLIYIIFSHSCSPMCNLNRYIVNILKAYVKDENNNVKNYATFFNYIMHISPENDKIMVSFEITSLYTFI